jgi:MraZ protein
MVFYGEYVVSFTAGGRLVLPKKIRSLVKGSQFVITKGFDQCLAGYDGTDWEKRSGEFLSTSLLSTSALELRRIVFSGAVYVDLDEQGRFVLPKILMDYIGVKEKAVFTGVGDHFEIWDQKMWRQYLLAAAKKTNLLDKNEQ